MTYILSFIVAFGVTAIAGQILIPVLRRLKAGQSIRELSLIHIFIEIGQRLGAEKFYEYFQAFGMTEKTGIDLPGEEKGVNWGSNMGIVDLAVASFGQRFNVTPLSLIHI